MRNIFIGGKMDCQSLIYKSAMALPHDQVITFREPTSVAPGLKYTKDTADHSQDTILCVGLQFGYMPSNRDAYENALPNIDSIKFNQSKESMKMLRYLAGYKSIIHFIVDPLEIPLSLYFDHAKCVSDYGYTSKQGIVVTQHDMYRRYLKKLGDKLKMPFNDRPLTLYFGANEFTTGSKERKLWLEFVKDSAPMIRQSLGDKCNLFINSKGDKTNQVSQESYYRNLSESRFTLVGPANAPGHFSSLRVSESASVNCIPLVWKHSNYEIVGKDLSDIFVVFDTVEELLKIIDTFVMTIYAPPNKFSKLLD